MHCNIQKIGMKTRGETRCPGAVNVPCFPSFIRRNVCSWQSEHVNIHDIYMYDMGNVTWKVFIHNIPEPKKKNRDATVKSWFILFHIYQISEIQAAIPQVKLFCNKFVMLTSIQS